MFNTEQICRTCKTKEREHPEYERAHRIEVEHVKRGDYRFPGVGLPDDLRRR
jgi:hypothetical protein